MIETNASLSVIEAPCEGATMEDHRGTRSIMLKLKENISKEQNVSFGSLPR